MSSRRSAGDAGGVIEAAGLCRDYGQRRALGPVDWSVAGGRVVALIGPNGAGKTTLLRLVMGLIEPSRGEVRLLGHDARRMPAEVASLVGWVGDGHEPPRWASLRGLMRLQAEAAGCFNQCRAEILLAARGLSPTRRYGQLSKGQKRWVLSSLALASRPDVLIFDEPADGLDPAARRHFYDLVREDVTDRGSTAVIATHVLADIERVADEVVVMHHGLIRLHEELETLRDEVREVELPSDAPLIDPGPAIEQIIHWRSADARRLLVRCRNGQRATLERRFGHDALIRPVSLETLYAGLTQPATDNSTDSEE